jgi:hypothetical protein
VASKILFERLKQKADKWEVVGAFDTFDAFFARASDFRKADTQAVLRVSIPGGFPVTAEERAKIDDLGIINPV